jgi:hypothetical protein
MIGSMGVGGMALGGRDFEGKRVWHVPPMPIETQVLSGPLSQQDLESYQFSSFLRLAQATGATGELTSSQHIIDDPPDLVVAIGGGPELAVELTSLSVTDVSRQRVDEIRRIAREVTAKMASDPTKYVHLLGRVVLVAEHATDDARPQKRKASEREALVDAIATSLQQDFGVAFQFEADADGHVPPEAARRGTQQIDEYTLTVQTAHQVSDTLPSVTADIQINIHEDDLVERLTERVDAKDVAANRILLISTGLPDKQGFVIPADRYVFESVIHVVEQGLAFNPNHLDEVILHHWGSGDAMVLYQRSGAPVLLDTTTSAWKVVP